MYSNHNLWGKAIGDLAQEFNVPWVLMSHPQIVEVHQCGTAIYCNHVNKRCHHLSHMCIFYLKNILNHILYWNHHDKTFYTDNPKKYEVQLKAYPDNQ